MATLICPRVTCLRSIAPTYRALRGPAGPDRSASFSTASKPQKQPRLSTPWIPSICKRIPPQSFHPAPVQAVRFASTAPDAAPATASPPFPQQRPEKTALTWKRFFELRRKRRWINLGASLTTAAAAVGIGAPAITVYDIDSWGAQQFGLDPFIVLGICGTAVFAGGWLAGPFFGGAAFQLIYARAGFQRMIAEKEKSFYARVKRYRADPSSSSPQNPIPDYYGEKIGSVKGYRRWLKDQRAFNLKKDKNML